VKIDKRPLVETAAPDRLNVDITFVHPEFDLKRITQALSVEPTYA
jgi:hypothetical protein